MNNWTEFAKDFNEMVGKNFEVMSKYCKATIDQNETVAKTTMDNYFNYLQTNVNYMRDLWETSIKDREDLRVLYNENMKKVYDNMTKVYNDTVTKFTTQK